MCAVAAHRDPMRALVSASRLAGAATRAAADTVAAARRKELLLLVLLMLQVGCDCALIGLRVRRLGTRIVNVTHA